jgi:hypothetical protein
MPELRSSTRRFEVEDFAKHVRAQRAQLQKREWRVADEPRAEVGVLAHLSLQILIEPGDGLIEATSLVLGFDEHVPFAGVDDELGRDSECP